MKKYVVLYESADDITSRARAHFPAHKAHYESFQEEDFVSRDPFVVHGVVKGWQLREWNEAIAE